MTKINIRKWPDFESLGRSFCTFPGRGSHCINSGLHAEKGKVILHNFDFR